MKKIPLLFAFIMMSFLSLDAQAKTEATVETPPAIDNNMAGTQIEPEKEVATGSSPDCPYADNRCNRNLNNSQLGYNPYKDAQEVVSLVHGKTGDGTTPTSTPADQ